MKKRSKKLLLLGVRGPIGNGPRTPRSKSFLVLFFKKEHLLSLIANRYTGTASEQYPTANNRISADPFGWLGATSAIRPAL